MNEILDDTLRRTVWEEKYKALEDKTPEDTFKRVATVIGQNKEEQEAFMSLIKPNMSSESVMVFKVLKHRK